jgi:predicted molibdopterin-dependent oxidoreductase YjgC
MEGKSMGLKTDSKSVTERVSQHPILGPEKPRKTVIIHVNGQPIEAKEGEPIASALIAAGIMTFRTTRVLHEPRGYFCGIGLCSDCMMTVDDIPNIRTCITQVQEGMRIETQSH